MKRLVVLALLLGCEAAPTTPAHPPAPSSQPANEPLDTLTVASARASSSAPPPRSPSNKGGTIELPLEKREALVVSLPAAPGRQPVLVVTHGAGGRATIHCALWRRIVGKRGFIICPRGRAMYPYEKREGHGYYWDGHHELGAEVAQSVEALSQRFPKQADLDDPIFAGYSQGASMGSMVLPTHAAKFARAALLEGGFGQYQEWNVASSKRFFEHGGRRVLLVCGRSKCLDLAHRTASYMRRGGLVSRVEHAVGAGHTYGTIMEKKVDEVFEWLIEDDPRWRP